MTAPMWQPSRERIENARLTAFMKQVERDHGVACREYRDLWEWSRRDQASMEKFWLSIWDFCGVIAETRGETVIQDFDKMPGAAFFPDARLNFAQNLLRQRGAGDAVVFWGEDKVKRRLSHDELYERVARVAQGLRELGVKEGDRVAAYLPNMPETIIAMLATASIGAIFSSCSPDFGVQGVLDRFGQIEPKVLFAVDAYHYNGKVRDVTANVAAVAEQLPTLEKILLVNYAGDGDASALANAERLDAFEARQPGGGIEFAQMPFNHPLYIMFSSGTTGKPKCIVHGAGGTLLQHLKEHQLHTDVQPGDRAFYFTTCGWMMWNWIVSALAANATVMLYDGSPFHPDWRILFRYAEAERITMFGTSAKFIDTLGNQGARPIDEFDLSSVRTMTSTGSPLLAEGFDVVYNNVKQDICLSSISGGTDIVSCFVLGNPIGPVYRGEIQVRGLGMDVDIFDDQGRSVRGEKGELVCKKPFPCMPVRFWNDPGGERFHNAYFADYPGIWHHGDFAALTENDGIIIYGRSDATLNPGGVRIGTAEIYRQVEKLEEIEEAIVIGQDVGDDQRVVLFVRLKNGLELSDELVDRIKQSIRKGASPRHVPAKVLQVPDIPRTRSGKIVELAVRDVVHGRQIKNKEALANPEALDHFRDRPELQA
ncbi:acetoacetate--CoA ligase [Ferruginivarius sediminum]|uniref:Acetoacetate--CoA ligase n=1 Tax=Ferruginivarius sediminum TaxID=2661937 RepID=A0A369T789_9PROT|nr:acetoacetate--CoA ligase [Ferruginivarius sediminum]RDD60225.1 acetoacetate--CoA ligase [Ferruginivarius sediminum]